AAPRPRFVPLSTRLVAIFGSRFSIFGWFFFAFGMLFACIFAANADWSSLFLFRGNLESADGKIISSEKTTFSEGGNKHHHGTPISAHHYQFHSDEKNYEGISYQLGEASRADESVRVEYPKDRAGYQPVVR